MIKELYIKADNYYIKFRTSCEKSVEYINNHLDEFSKVTICFDIIKKQKVDFTIQYIDGSNNSFDIISNNEIKIQFLWLLNDKKSILPIIFRQIVEMLRQLNGEIKVHASAVEKNGKAILFIAPSEGGKTTTAMAMCQKFGYSLFANDAAVIKFNNGKPIMLRGDQEFKVRLNGLKSYSNQYFEKESTNFKEKNELWYNKSKIKPDDIGVSLANSPLPVTHIFFVKLDTLINGCISNYYNSCKDIDKWFKPKMMLFQNINGTIRGGDLIPYGNNGKILNIVIPSLDTSYLYLNRVNFINDLFDVCEIYQLRGTLEGITSFINEKMI